MRLRPLFPPETEVDEAALREQPVTKLALLDDESLAPDNPDEGLSNLADLILDCFIEWQQRKLLARERSGAPDPAIPNAEREWPNGRRPR